ncbi:6,7-dimethyl-8-ribityllumazine synthase [Nakamurella silvestris]|nr:6,7-dimethyl-8-ribityllumazine synthase [Nakamurella silvestris]
MSGDGRPELRVAPAPNLRVGIVLTEWNSEVTEILLERALAVAAEAGTRTPTVVRVPGAVELPVVAQQLSTNHDAVVALGLVVQGGTPHFEYVCDAVTYGLTRVSLDSGVPVGNGVLTCLTMDQAWDRSGRPGSKEDKGAEAMAAALATAKVLKDLKTPSTRVGFGSDVG